MPSITKAVASSVKTPGFYLIANLLGAVSNPGTAPNRTLLMAPKSSAGNIVPDTEVRQCFGPDDVAVALGAGTPGHLCAKRLFAQHGLASLDVVAPTASAGAAATGSQTFTGPASQNSTIRFRIHGRIIDVAWLSGESAATFVTRAVATINAQAADLFVTAAADTADIDYTAKVAGPWGNDVLINASIVEGGGGIAITVNPAALTSGTTEPSFATALALVSTRRYRRIIPCVSNADALSSSGTSNPGRLATHIDQYETGLGAKLQVGCVGITATIANAKAGAIAKNNEALQYVFGQTFEDLPAELAGAEVGDSIKCIALRPNFNRIGNKLLLRGPKDAVTSKLTDAQVEDLLNNGVTPLGLEEGTNEVFVIRPITTHSLFSGAPDYRALDMSDTDGLYSVAEDLQVVLPQEFKNCSISPDLPAGSQPLPPGVVELRDVKNFTLSRLRAWVREGVVNGPALEAANDNDELIFEIDSGDPKQVNIFLPLKIIAPLAKMGAVVSKVA